MIVFLYTLTAATASGAPEQIGLNYGETPSDMVVSWASFSSETLGYVQYGLESGNLSMTSSASGATYTLGKYTSPMIYKVVLSGLQVGNTIYYYRVGSESTGFSPVYSFKTHPGVGVNRPVTFHVYGDLGQTSNSQETLQEINENEAALTTMSGGIFSMGDLSYANGNQPLWDSFMNLRQLSSVTIPTLTTLGKL